MSNEELVTASTTAIATIKKSNRRESSLLQSDYLSFLESPEDYSDLSFSPEEAESIRRKLSHLSTGAFAAIPLICSETCPFTSNCPFYAMGKIPINRSCLVESNLLKEWVISYINEYQVEVESITDRILVQDLAEIELLMYRINSNLAKTEYAELVEETNLGVDREGNRITRREIVALMELKLKLQNRRDKLLKLMVGDRQEKYKKQALLKEKDGTDIASTASSLKQKILEMSRKMDALIISPGPFPETGKETEEESPLRPEDLIGD